MPLDYDDKVKLLAKEARDKLTELYELFQSGNNTARAMDVSEAINSLDSAVEEI